MKRIAVTVVLALIVLGPTAAAGAVRTDRNAADTAAFFCVFSKSVSVAGQTVSTPTVCIPSP